MADVQRTPRELLEARGELADDIVAVVIEGAIVDLHTPVAEGAAFEPLRASDPRALSVIRHSTAHVMADAVQKLFPGTQVTIGPSIDSGFYYDFSAPITSTFTDKDLAQHREGQDASRSSRASARLSSREMTSPATVRRSSSDRWARSTSCEIIDAIGAR
jgi:hypothetical protein